MRTYFSSVICTKILAQAYHEHMRRVCLYTGIFVQYCSNITLIKSTLCSFEEKTAPKGMFTLLASLKYQTEVLEWQKLQYPHNQIQTPSALQCCNNRITHGLSHNSLVFINSNIDGMNTVIKGFFNCGIDCVCSIFITKTIAQHH